MINHIPFNNGIFYYIIIGLLIGIIIDDPYTYHTVNNIAHKDTRITAIIILRTKSCSGGIEHGVPGQ
jgi:hypothetical protein